MGFLGAMNKKKFAYETLAAPTVSTSSSTSSASASVQRIESNGRPQPQVQHVTPTSSQTQVQHVTPQKPQTKPQHVAPPLSQQLQAQPTSSRPQRVRFQSEPALDSQALQHPQVTPSQYSGHINPYNNSQLSEIKPQRSQSQPTITQHLPSQPTAPAPTPPNLQRLASVSSMASTVSSASRTKAKLREIFRKKDINADGVLSEDELRKVLINTDSSHFDSDSIRFLFDLYDLDGNGALDFDEFYELWKFINDHREIFASLDVRRCSYITQNQFEGCIRGYSYCISDKTIEHIFLTYSNANKDSYGSPPVLKLDKFICAFCRAREAHELISTEKNMSNGQIQLRYDQAFEYLLNSI